jgi:KDO2-lipid IV(A) lauroyltransferase
VALRALFGLLAALPLSAALRLAELGALVVYAVGGGLRRVGMQNLGIAFPEKPVAERRRILRSSFLNLGRMAAEMAHFPSLTAAQLEQMVQFEDEAWWREHVAQPRGTGGLVLSGHFGNWELLVFAHGMRGFPVTMVHRAIRNPLIDRWLHAIRRRAGTRLVRKSRAATEVLRALRDNSLLVLPFDQNSTRRLGVFVDFFGLAASTNVGIARLALRTGAPVVPAFIVRQGRSARHVVHILPLMEAERTGNPDDDVRHNTARFSAVFEDMVRRYPEQWLWMHKRWKTRPVGEAKIY